MSKRCTECQVVKRDTDFHVDNRSYSGRQSRCKECLLKIQRKHYRVNYSKFLKDEGLALGGKKRVSRSKENNKCRESVKNITHAAIRSGKIKKNPCEVCGDMQVDAHHCNYSRPLDVLWLCKLHHVEWHSRNKVIYP
jgi:hypothetical protein